MSLIAAATVCTGVGHASAASSTSLAPLRGGLPHARLLLANRLKRRCQCGTDAGQAGQTAHCACTQVPQVDVDIRGAKISGREGRPRPTEDWEDDTVIARTGAD
jgi:hypothetical protein